jgi:hypothetical protein
VDIEHDENRKYNDDEFVVIPRSYEIEMKRMLHGTCESAARTIFFSSS